MWSRLRVWQYLGAGASGTIPNDARPICAQAPYFNTTGFFRSMATSEREPKIVGLFAVHRSGRISIRTIHLTSMVNNCFLKCGPIHAFLGGSK